MAYRVVVVDDHRLVADGVRRALAEARDFEIVGQARDGAEAVPLVDRLRPDLVLLDIQMPRMDGITCLERLMRTGSDSKVVMLSAHKDAEYVQASLDRGASAFVLKSISPSDLVAALRQTMEGTVATGPLGLPSDDEDMGASAGLSERETCVLRLAAEGRSNREIAGQLWITEQTVKFHLTNTYRKLRVGNRTEAAREAYRLGIADSPGV
jgi:DNA-binding NarL/FixJ family response regulator